MRIRKNEVRLLEFHPTLFEDVIAATGEIYAPLILDQNQLLIDGYRRYHAYDTNEISCVVMYVDSPFEAAFQLNRHTRVWDEVDCFLWARCASKLDVPKSMLPRHEFPPALNEASDRMIRAIANRKINWRQALRILQSPHSSRDLFTDLLTGPIRLNANETAVLMELIFDLANLRGIKNLSLVLQEGPFQTILLDHTLDRRQRGEALLKAMRNLRYPLYQKKLEALSPVLNRLESEKVFQIKKNSLLERGVLELTITARSQEEMEQKVRNLYENLKSEEWSKVWQNE